MNFEEILVANGEFRILMQILLQRKYLRDGKSFIETVSCALNAAIVDQIVDSTDHSECSQHRDIFLVAWGLTSTQKKILHMGKQQQIQNVLKKIDPAQLVANDVEASIIEELATLVNEEDNNKSSALMHRHHRVGFHYSDPDSAIKIKAVTNATNKDDRIKALKELATYAGIPDYFNTTTKLSY
jgi:hypothetical protein